MKIERFEEIEAWKAGRKLTQEIYALTSQPKFAKDFGLRDQIQRASVSIMANIVHPVKYMRWTISRGKGFDGRSTLEFIRFLGYAFRSATEVQSHLYVALDQEYLMKNDFENLYQQAVETKKLMNGFIRYLRKAAR